MPGPIMFIAHSLRHDPRARLALGGGVILLLCVLAYWPGLTGPFVFDDTPNLVVPLQSWLHGDISWREIVFGNNSGMLGRPLSMLSFLANAAIAGMDTLGFKITNLGIHLLCGCVLFALLVRLLARDPSLKRQTVPAALLISGLWLLHPIQVSTVLYIVQRMAQLSALFVLLGLLAYVYGRQFLENGRAHLGWAMLFVAVPLLTLVASLCKENGALLPLLCTVIEVGYFRPVPMAQRPRAVALFVIAFVMLPSAAATAWYGIHPEKLLGAYDGRLFTLGERMLSQPRALMGYMHALTLPSGPSLGIYTDDFAISHGLFDPPSTLWSILALAALVVAVVAARVRAPAFFTGMGLYLVGHLMESTVFPLELYFEHRNYLPSAGFFLALIGLIAWLVAKVLPSTDNPERTLKSLRWSSAVILGMFALATWARAGAWSSTEVIAAQGLQQHPMSVRANIDQARVLQTQGHTAEVQKILERMANFNDPQARHVSAINSVYLQCITTGATSPAAMKRIGDIAGAKLEVTELLMFENLVRFMQEHQCTNIDKAQLAFIIINIVDAAPQSPRLTQIWRDRFYAAKLLASSGHAAEAQDQLELAWGTGSADPAVGAFLVQVQLARGDIVGASRTLPQVSARIATWDRRGQSKVTELQALLAAAQRTSHPAR